MGFIGICDNVNKYLGNYVRWESRLFWGLYSIFFILYIKVLKNFILELEYRFVIIGDGVLRSCELLRDFLVSDFFFSILNDRWYFYEL